jgi:hypothetical protein
MGALLGALLGTLLGALLGTILVGIPGTMSGTTLGRHLGCRFFDDRQELAHAGLSKSDSETSQHWQSERQSFVTNPR